MGSSRYPSHVMQQCDRPLIWMERCDCYSTDCCAIVFFTQAMLKLADVNGDGRVDLSDFYKTMRKTSAF